MIPKEHFVYLGMMCCASLKDLRKLDKWRSKEGLKKRSTADEQYLKGMSLRNGNKSSKDLTQDLRDASDPSVDPPTVH